MKDIHRDCIWQTRDEMPQPTNPLQKLVEMLTGTSRDISQDQLLSAIYGVVVGWDDESYEEFKNKYGWGENVKTYQKQLHQNYIECWDKYMK